MMKGNGRGGLKRAHVEDESVDDDDEGRYIKFEEAYDAEQEPDGRVEVKSQPQDPFISDVELDAVTSSVKLPLLCDVFVGDLVPLAQLHELRAGDADKVGGGVVSDGLRLHGLSGTRRVVQ